MSPKATDVKRVVIVAHPQDEHADAVQKVLTSIGAHVFRVSRELLPLGDIAWAPGGEASFDGKRIGPSAGFWRRPGSPDTSSVADDFARFVSRECEDAFDAALLMSPISWLSTPSAVHEAELKINQLGRANTLGLRIPATIITNSAAEATDFASRHRFVVVKPVRYGLLTSGPQALVAWASRTSQAELASLTGSPVIVQEEIVAAFHLRVVTVDQQCFVSELQCQELDWRSRLENHNRFRAAELGSHPEVAAGAAALAGALKVGYSSQDWIVDKESRPWFLDLNPSGQWLFVDEVHGGAITAEIANRLMTLATPAELVAA